jgi:predicted kinase
MKDKEKGIKMLKIIFYRGIPGSGKSTDALEFCKKNPSFVRVNRDDFRLSRGRYWIPEQEDLITEVERSMVLGALKRGLNVIIDAMNLNEKYMAQWAVFLNKIQKDEGILPFTIEIKKFDTDLYTCIERDAMRPKGRRCGAKLIKQLYYRYIADVRPVEHVKGLPHAIISDIDGTIALNEEHRGTYDYTKVSKDFPNDPVIQVINDYLRDDEPDRNILFMSGRDDSCRNDTALWIKEHLRLSPIQLFMRKTGDRRKDSIVKRELFEEHIRGKYNIDFVLDDRNQVVDMWRNELGLTCLQVAEGDF